MGEKLVVFVEFKKEILRTYVLGMTVKGWLININIVILSEAKNLLLLLNFLSDAIKEFEK
ncbi:MAG: hypothetical protein JHC31_13000 [Sulfurihydrogenibium sp.]|nr:hypothetical protein [Sulfurihydrogenibium sp.]